MSATSSTIDRRRFLICSSACALGSAALASSASGEGRPEAAAEPLAVGYWRGEKGDRQGGLASAAEVLLDPANRTVAPKVVPAESLAAGDPRLERAGARVTVHGLVGEVDALDAAGIRSAALQVHFHPVGSHLPETVKFHSWSVTRGRLPSVSSALRFRVPVDAGGLDLSLDLDHDATAADRMQRIFLGRSYKELGVRLAVGRERHQPKLREGFYFIPLRQEAFRRPGAVSGLDVRSEPCLMLSVEAA